VDGLCTRLKLGRGRGWYYGGGVSAGADPNIAEALMYSAEALVYSAEVLSGRLIVDTVVGHSGQ